jgi:hypothetical protein
VATNTLNDVADGDTIFAIDPNSIHQALNGQFVGRNSSGVPAAGQDLGTTAIPWGTVRANSLVVAGSAIDPSTITVPQNRVISGAVRASSNQPAYLVPNGAALSFVLDATPTTFAYDVNGTSYSIASDITKGSLTAAPSTQNTALINDTEAAGQEDTRLWGEPEHRKTMIIDTAGTNITALVGKFAAFKLAGGATEYFLAFVKSATELTNVRRGYFYDDAINPINRTTFSNNDTLTLMKLGWVFVDRDGSTIDVSYTNPTWGFTAPGSPIVGDYWYDLSNSVWKRFDGADFITINRVFAGNVINSTTACVAARCLDFHAGTSELNTIDVDLSTTEIVNGTTEDQIVSVMGHVFRFEKSYASWNITTDLAIAADMYNVTEQISTLYYLYISDEGETIISDISPYHRSDLQGAYHPHNPWRCVGLFYNDASGDIDAAGGVSRQTLQTDEVLANTGNGHGAVDTDIRRFSTVTIKKGSKVTYLESANKGSYAIANWPCECIANYSDNASGAFFMGLTLSSSELTTSVGSLVNTASLKAFVVSSTWGSITAKMNLKIGDVIRPHTDSSPNGTSVQDMFRLVTSVK